MKNYFTLEQFSLLYDHYAFIDVPEYYADQLFLQHKVTVRFGNEFQHPDQPYVVIFCKVRKRDRDGYRPHAGYVDWSYVDGKWMPTGKYIKYPKNSNCQNWCKKASSARVRKYMDLPHKGNSYRRVFDYWWTLY